jgi:twinkle protein
MNAGELAQRLAQDAEGICTYLLPNGVRKGPEWKAGSVDGEEGQSLSVRLSGNKAGVWMDFQKGEGGDLLDLWCAVRGLSLAEAIREAKDHLGVNDERQQREEKTYKRPTKPQCQTPKSRVREWLASRGIEERTIAAFKVGEQLRDGKVYAVFPYLRDGELVNVKYRNPDEKKDMRQEGGAEPCLFGWHLIDPRARTVAITEGEIDAMTLWQAGIPALSVNAGAGNHQWIESDWERLERFSEILVAFDADESGEKGAKEVIARLGMERCKRLKFPAKDANQWLMDGACGEDFQNVAKDAKPDDPPELRRLSDYMGKVKAMFYPVAGDRLDPVLRLDQDMPWFEFRRGELTVWTGYNGHGKSLALSQVELGLVQQGERFCVFSGEMPPERQLKRMSKQASGLDKPTSAYLDAIAEWLIERIWVFDVVGSATIDRLLEVFEYAAKRYGIGHFVIDSLMMTDVPEDGPGALTEQKRAIQKLCNFAKRTNSHIHLVAHPRKGRDESSAPGKMDVAGAGKITDGADNVFTVWAALKDESEPMTDDRDATLEIHKQRNGEVQHKTVSLWFNKAAQQYATNSRRRSIRYVDFSTQPAEVEL